METKGGVPAGRIVLVTKKFPTWPQDGLPYRAKIDEKSMPKSIEILMRFRLHLGSHFAPSWVPKWSQLGLQSAPKSRTNRVQEGVRWRIDVWEDF